MIYEISVMWLWAPLAFLAGGATGWSTYGAGPQTPWFHGWFRWSLIAFGIGVIVSWLHWLPGRVGFALETALIFYAAYVAGCLVGGALNGGLQRKDTAVSTAAAASAGANAGFAAEMSKTQPDLRRSEGGVNVSDATDRDEPAAMGALEGEEKHGGRRPPGWVSARGGLADDLKRIRGVGPQNESHLHPLGIWRFAQIADWTPENVEWVGSYLAFPGRIEREEWILQAKALAAGREPNFTDEAKPKR